LDRKGNKNRNKLLAIGLGIFQVFIGVGAIDGGYLLISDPSGANMGFDLELLRSSPFKDYLIPGVLLFSINGLGSILGGLLSIMRYRFSGELAMILGLFLVLWIIFQMLWIGLVSWIQPLYLVFGFIELYLGWSLRRNLSLKASN
jgi:hypothetical protein